MEIVAGLLFIGLIAFITTKIVRYIDNQQAIAAKNIVLDRAKKVEAAVAELTRSELLDRLRPDAGNSDSH